MPSKTPGKKIITSQYKDFLCEIKTRVRNAQNDALKSVNKQLVSLYWEVGRMIVERQKEHGWGRGVVKMLAEDLQNEFQGIRGFSIQNLWNMRMFYLSYEKDKKLQTLSREISWSHNVAILSGCKDDNKERNALRRQFYIQETLKHFWSFRTLKNHLQGQTFEKKMISQTNFPKTVATKQLKEARLAVVDEYNFSFLGLGEDYREKELEDALVGNIQRVLMEFGNYFTFIGRQYRVIVEDDEFFLDILLYHRKLRCLVAIEIKNTSFKPEYAGKMNFYLNVLNDKVKLKDENDAIGIILCRDKKRTTVEYALKDVNKPMGVASYNLTKSLPKELKNLLPSVEELKHRLQDL